MIKDNVTKTLNELGFRPEEIEGFGCRFEYEGLSILYSEEDEETQCVNFIAPGVFNITPENRQDILEAMIKLSCKMKYVQPIIMFDDSVCLNYQHYVGDNEVNANLIEHMNRVLAAATIIFHRIINGEDNDE